MTELEERVRTYAASALAETSPVTAAEVRGVLRPTTAAAAAAKVSRLLAVAAAVLGVLGVAAAVAMNNDRGGATNVSTGPSTFPRTLDGHRDWNLAVLNGDLEPSDADMEARFSEGFLDAVSPEKFRSSSAPLIAMAPWRVIAEVERRGEEVLAVQLASKTGEQARLTIHRDTEGQVDGSTILAAAPCADAVPPDTQLDAALTDSFAWITELLASTSTPTDDELRQRFSPSFLEAVPAERLRAGLPQLRELGPYTLRSFEGPPTTVGLTARVGVRTGEEARLTLAVEPAPPHRITGFSVFTQAPCRVPTSS